MSGIRNAFAHDDVLFLFGDVRIRAFSGIVRVFSEPYWPPPFQQDLYRPISTLLLATEFALSKGNPIVFRLVSYGLYAVAAVAFLAVARRILSRRTALLAAILFAVHPVHVEAVALGVNQNELIIAIVACVMVVRYLNCRPGTLSRRDWVVLAGLYLLSSLLKESGLALIGLLALTEILLVPGPLKRRLFEVWKGFATLSVVAVTVIIVRTVVVGGWVGSFTAEALANLGFGRRALTMLQVVPQWARLLLWPAHLRADYSPQEFVASTGFGWRELLGLALASSTVAGIWWFRRRAPAVAFGLGWVVVALLPVSNLVPTGILIAERTLFLATIGALIVVGGVLDLLERRAADLRVSRVLIGTCLGIALIGLVRSSRRQRVWRNDAVLWLTSAQDAPRSFRVQYALGDILFDLGQIPAGIVAYRAAIATAPQPWRIQYEFARRLRDRSMDAAAVNELRASLAARPEQPDALAELVAALIAIGDYAEARREGEASAEASAPVISGLVRVADSAAAVGAAPGSIRLRIRRPSDSVIRPGAY